MRVNSTRRPTLRLPYILRKDLDVVFCGINPALSAARAGHHFSSPNNRFWRVLFLAEFTPHLIRPENDSTILQYGYGLTAAVERPTVRASELTSHEFREAAGELERKLRRYRPRYLAFLGKPAFAAIFRKGSVDWGQQFMRFGGAEVWVLPNPSGLNRAFSLEELVSAYRDLRTASKRTTSNRDKRNDFLISSRGPLGR
jgi:double-stranded uracil-DNA glycosylase